MEVNPEGEDQIPRLYGVQSNAKLNPWNGTIFKILVELEGTPVTESGVWLVAA